MKKSKLLKIISIILSLFMLNVISKNQKIEVFATENDSSEIVMERDSKRVLKRRNENVAKEMASTTKIATAITVIKNCNLDDEVLITDEMVNVEGSSIYLKVGERLKVIDLLYGLMLRSGNDSACALALHCSNNIDNFAKLMNKTAKDFGCTNTNFTNPHGLHDDNHYTTCYDLALITCNALDNEVFSKIVSTKKYVCVNSDGHKRVFYNKNKLLNTLDGCDGVKTGYTKDAGRCLVSSATRNGMQIVCVVLDCAPMFERSSELLNECFSAYNLNKLVSKDNSLGEIEIDSDCVINKKLNFCIKNDIVLPLTNDELYNINYVYNVPKTIDFPIKNNSCIGEMEVYCGNNLLCKEKLYIIGGKTSYDYVESIKIVVERWKIYENK